jgi:hypothetical protein
MRNRMIVFIVCVGFLDDVRLGSELVSAVGINEGEGCVGSREAVVLVELGVQELYVGECSCEVVLEDNLAFFVCVVKGDAGRSIFRLDVPVSKSPTSCRAMSSLLILADSGSLQNPKNIISEISDAGNRFWQYR